MRLELNILNIKDVQFAGRTAIREGVLHVNRSELQELLLEDKSLGQVDIELAHPGESCRILKVYDVVEPRAKSGGDSEDFPGTLAKHGSVGSGCTCVLRSVAVVMSDCSRTGESAGRDPHGEIIDMSGPAADFSIYGKTHNIVVLPYPANGVSLQDYRIALKMAGLKTAVYLAKAGRELEPDEIEVYDLPPIIKATKGMENLSKVAYIFQVLTTQFEPIPGEPVFYGINVDSIVPTIIHPNEVLDGALTRPDRTYGVETYVIQNHPIIRELYRRHGKELYFAGVIITIAYNNAPEYERAATVAANLARWVIGADGVILTKTGGGAPEITMAQTAQKCEELGVKTAVAMLHMAADPNDTKFEAATIFNMPEVDAIVSMGTPFMPLTLPAMERIIGRPAALPEGPPIDGEIVRLLFWIKGTTSQLGHTRLIATRY